MDLPASLQAGLGHCFKEPFPIRVILEYRLLPITPVHDMINRSRVLEPKFSGHASHATQPGELLSITWSDPFRPLYFTFMNECTSRGRHPCEPMCGIPCERIRPTAGWLLEAQAGREQVVVRVSHSIARPRAACLSEALAEAALRCSTARPRITNISSR